MEIGELNNFMAELFKSAPSSKLVVCNIETKGGMCYFYDNEGNWMGSMSEDLLKQFGETHGKKKPPPRVCSFDDYTLMPWGKHEGEEMCEVPDHYLEWIRDNMDNLDSDLIEYIEGRV